MRVWIPVALALIGGTALAVAAGPATVAAQEEKIQKLREQALHAGHYPTTQAALMELRTMGEAAQGTILEVVKELLDRDAAEVERAAEAVSDSQGFRAADAVVTRVRPLALANLAKLAKAEALTKAREYHDQLAAAQGKVNAVLGAGDTARQIMARRPQLVDLYRKQAPPEKGIELASQEAKVKAAAQKAMAGAPAVPMLVDVSRPPKRTEPSFRLWHFRACRQLETYNETVGPKFASAAEMENLRAVNAYREALGLLALEIDPRLTQAARKHSKEMVEKKYFSHESPTPSEKDAEMRVINAGYQPRVVGENIFQIGAAVGGREAFWYWFTSPGHHKEMVSSYAIAFGAGRWHTHWTQNYGLGARLSQVDEALRAKIIADGKVPMDDAGK